MNWKILPSLAALRAFEATARHATYVSAAAELNVTDAALRQHVRALEARFSCPLIRRAGRGIILTKEGTRLSKALAIGFGAIAEGVADMDRKRANQPVRVACTPAFAETWLMPRLPDFWAQHPEIEVDLAPSLRNVDLAGGAYDLAIRYGRGDWAWPEMARIASAAYTFVNAGLKLHQAPERKYINWTGIGLSIGPHGGAPQIAAKLCGAVVDPGSGV